MKYTWSDKVYKNSGLLVDKNLAVMPGEFSKNSSKELLQYAVGGLLYMPASNKSFVKKYISGEYRFIKSIVLDLEDALGDDLIGFGKRNIVNVCKEFREAVEDGNITADEIPLIFIRVRCAEHITETINMLGDNAVVISGFNIPKFDKFCCEKYVDAFTKADEHVYKIDIGIDGLRKTKLYMMPIIENKTAMYRQLRIDNLLTINECLRNIQENVLNIRVGGADFNSLFGIRRNYNHTIYECFVVNDVLSDIFNIFGKNYVVSGPVWEYFKSSTRPDDTRWLVGLKREIIADINNGFIGKTCIHPSQVPYVQQSLIVSHDDYVDAQCILGMNSNVTGVTQSDAGGRMNEVKTHTKWAQKVILLASLYGVASKDVETH